MIGVKKLMEINGRVNAMQYCTTYFIFLKYFVDYNLKKHNTVILNSTQHRLGNDHK